MKKFIKIVTVFLLIVIGTGYFLYKYTRVFDKLLSIDRNREKKINLVLEKLNKIPDDDIKERVFTILDFYRTETNSFTHKEKLFMNIIDMGNQTIPYLLDYVEKYPEAEGRPATWVLRDALIEFKDHNYKNRILSLLQKEMHLADVVKELKYYDAESKIIEAIDLRSQDTGWVSGCISPYTECLSEFKSKKSIPVLKKVFNRQYPRYHYVYKALVACGDTSLHNEYYKLYQKTNDNWDKIYMSETIYNAGDIRGLKNLVRHYDEFKNSLLLKDKESLVFRTDDIFYNLTHKHIELVGKTLDERLKWIDKNIKNGV